MAGHGAAGGKHHRPGHVRRPAPQFAIYEIGESPEKKPDRPHRTGHVAEREYGNAAASGEQHHREDAADEPAMEGHAALPDLNDLRGVSEEEREVVEQHVADAPAEHDAERHPEDEIVVVDHL